MSTLDKKTDGNAVNYNKGYVRHPDYHLMERDAFIALMKADKMGWGKQHVYHNSFQMSQGYVNVFNSKGEFSRAHYFTSHPQKNEHVKSALRSIRNLPGAFIEISYA